MGKVRSNTLARLNSRSRSLWRLVLDAPSDLLLFANTKDGEDFPVNFRNGFGGVVLVAISYVSIDTSEAEDVAVRLLRSL